MKNIRLVAPVVALGVLCGLGCQTAKVTSDVALAAPASSAPVAVHVADFELGVESIQHEEGVLSGRPGPVGRIGTRLSGASKDPAGRARELVDLMADGLVKELSKAGLNASRLSERVPLATQGWLVRGVFTEVQEGNRMRRAMIGFGQGQTDMQVVATIHDLSQGEPKPLYEVATDASSGSTPGAAPTLVFSPYGAAVRFVMAGKDLDRGAKQTAARIAQQVLAHIRQADAK